MAILVGMQKVSIALNVTMHIITRLGCTAHVCMCVRVYEALLDKGSRFCGDAQTEAMTGDIERKNKSFLIGLTGVGWFPGYL